MNERNTKNKSWAFDGTDRAGNPINRRLFIARGTAIAGGLAFMADGSAHAAQGGTIVGKAAENKSIAGRWFTEFWGQPWNPSVIDALAAPDMLLQYSLHAPRKGRDDVRAFITNFRRAFPDLGFAGVGDLIAEGDYVVGRWIGGGTHAGPAFSDFLAGSLPAASGRRMRFGGTTVLKIVNGKIVEEVGLDDGVTALTQLGLLCR
jgi:predicted ester cyclase